MNALKALLSKLKLRRRGFTLAEMLIALALIGIIAALVIPKVLTGSSDKAKRTQVLVAAQAVTAAYNAYIAESSVKADTQMSDLLPFFNKIQDVPTGLLDGTDRTGTGSESAWQCGTQMQCIRLHSGEYIGFFNAGFGGTSNMHSIWMLVDVDGSPTTNGRGANTDNSIWLVLYANGRISSWSHITPGTLYVNYSSNAVVSTDPHPLSDPTWFYW